MKKKLTTGNWRTMTVSRAVRIRTERLLKRLEWPLAVLALLLVPVLILEDRTTDPTIRWLCSGVNWFVWLAFVGEFATGLAVATSRLKFAAASWFDLAIILLSPPFLVPDALQNMRSLRALRIFRLLRLVRGMAVATIGLRTSRKLLRHKGFHYVLVVAVATVTLGAAGIYIVEKNLTVSSVGDALWWAIVTVTTVGYGDVSPQTPEGRLIAVALMFVGIGVISALTATIASFFVEQDQGKGNEAIERRLAGVQERLDEVLSELQRHRAFATPVLVAALETERSTQSSQSLPL